MDTDLSAQGIDDGVFATRSAAPQKFIRTYARDMATVQKGGMPDLVPLGGNPPVFVPPPTLASSLPPVPPLTAMPPPLAAAPLVMQAPATPPPPPAVAHEDIVVPPPPPAVPIAPPAAALSVPIYLQTSQSARPVAPAASAFTLGDPGEPIPMQAPPPQPVVQPLPPSPLPPPVQAPPPMPGMALHTYTTDFSERVGSTSASAAAILAAEADAHLERPLPTPQPSIPREQRDRRRLISGGAFILVGAVAIFAAYAAYSARTGPVALFPSVSAPIFVDERETVSGQGTTLLQAFEESIGHPLPEGAMRLVYDPSATSTSLFNDLQLPAPGTLLRNINAQGSMAGVVTVNGNQAPFFILSVSSYGDTFAGMLAWEPSMLNALSPLYPAYPPGAATMSASTTAPALTPVIRQPPPNQGFVDEVVANHDARVYRDGEGRSVLVYGYWDQGTLVIARDEAAFTAILDRLASNQTR